MFRFCFGFVCERYFRFFYFFSPVEKGFVLLFFYYSFKLEVFLCFNLQKKIKHCFRSHVSSSTRSASVVEMKWQQHTGMANWLNYCRVSSSAPGHVIVTMLQEMSYKFIVRGHSQVTYCHLVSDNIYIFV